VGPVSFSGTQFTCFTSTKVPILTQQPRSDAELDHELQDLRAELGKGRARQFTCFTGTTVQILTQLPAGIAEEIDTDDGLAFSNAVHNLLLQVVEA
jgi:hypothetical protein